MIIVTEHIPTFVEGVEPRKVAVLEEKHILSISWIKEAGGDSIEWAAPSSNPRLEGYGTVTATRDGKACGIAHLRRS